VVTLLDPSAQACRFAVYAQAGAQKLPPPTRAAVIMALLGIALLGMLIVAIILLGGHWVRRQGGHRGRAVPPDREPIRRRGQSLDAADSQRAPGESAPAADTVSDKPNTG
jgi:hypothetical protein